MLFDGIRLVEGSELSNVVISSGNAFPPNPDQGEVFYRNDTGNQGLYIYNGSAWEKTALASDISNNAITLSGDISGSGTSTISTTLANSGVTAGTYGTASAVASFTVDAKGRITTVSDTAIEIAESQITDGSILARNAGNETISGTWSFNNPVNIATPTASTHAATKAYVDASTFDGTGDATFSGTINGSAATVTLASVITAGSVGSSSQVPIITFDTKGRITAASDTAIQIAETQITDGSILARNADNETISGTWSFNNPVTVAEPTTSTHAATKGYVDAVAQGLKTKPAVEIATTGPLTATYDNGNNGVGATLTGTGAFPTIDGVTLTSTTLGSNAVLVKNQTNPAHNGRYNLTSNSPNWVLTRCGLCDTADEIPASYVFVKQGTTYAGTGWVQIVSDPNTFTVGTDAISVQQFTGAGTYSAGAGLTSSGTVFNVGTASSSRIVVNTDDIDLATVGTAGTYNTVTVDAYGRVVSGTNTTTSIDTVIVSGTSQVAVANKHYVLTNTSAATTVTLPASPSDNDVVWVSNTTNRKDHVVARNGNLIQGDAEDLTINLEKTTVQLKFINTTIGWIITARS